MSEPFLGEIKIVSFNFPPKGWAFCNGQLLQINVNQALFSLFGTTYGGDGQRTFGLPNLQGRLPAHVGMGWTQGEVVGEIAHTITSQEMPTHNHFMMVSATGAFLNATGRNPAGHSPAMSVADTSPISSVQIWGTGAIGPTFAPNMIAPSGGSQPHENRQPYLALSFIVALVGIYPSPN